MKKILFLVTFILLLFVTNSDGFDNEITHREIVKRAIEESKKINTFLISNLNLLDGVETKIKGNGILWHIQEGSFLEDEPECRASNHFHNPLQNWDESGMKDEPWFIDLRCFASEYPPKNIKSDIHWATGYIEPAPDGAKEDTGNQWDWDHAREYFYTYLTGKILIVKQMPCIDREGVS